jgi:hypothetical protein
MEKIESGIPIPPLKFRAGAPEKYPFRHMQIHDSFFIARRTPINTKPWVEKTGFRFETRSVTENGLKGIRCWRVE